VGEIKFHPFLGPVLEKILPTPVLATLNSTFMWYVWLTCLYVSGNALWNAGRFYDLPARCRLH